MVSAGSAQLCDNRANGSKPCPVGGANVIIIVIQVFGVPTQLVQVGEANRINIAAVSGNQARGTDDGSVFSCVLTVTVGLGDCRDVRCSFSCFTLPAPSRSFFGARFFGHNDWKSPVCLQPLHNFPAAGQGDLVCAVRPQFGHLDGRDCAWDLSLGDGWGVCGRLLR